MSSGALNARAPAISKDGSAIAVAVGRGIHILASNTGVVLHTLVGHEGDVTGVAMSPWNSKQLLSCSVDGTVRTWDYEDTYLLHTVKLPGPAAMFCVSPSQQDIAYVVLGAAEAVIHGSATTETTDPTSRVLSVNVRTGAIVRKLYKKAGPYRAISVRKIALGTTDDEGNPKHTDLVAWLHGHRLCAMTMSDLQLHKYKHSRPLTCLAMHDMHNAIVTGDDTGVIIHWYCVANHALVPSKAATTSVEHWHAHAVETLAFAVDGTFLWSGGSEAVLVQWQLATGGRNFLPRLGAPLRTLAVGEATMVTGLEGNALVGLSTVELKRLWKVDGLGIAGRPSAERTLMSGMVLDPRTHALVLNSGASIPALQFYDPVSNQHVQDFTVVDRNFVSSTKLNEKSTSPVAVELVAFNRDGSMVATVDRSMGGTLESWNLKFWNFSREALQYVCITRVDSAHKARISALEFHPTAGLVVTASKDRTFKMWELHTVRSAAGDTTAWRCRSVGFYRDFPVGAATFSLDGSLLAVAYANVVTLWEPLANKLIKTLADPGADVVTTLSFAGASQFLLVGSNSRLTVWNLLDVSVWWSYACRVASLAVDAHGHGNTFAAALVPIGPNQPRHHGAPVVCVFDVSSAVPTGVFPQPSADGVDTLVYVPAQMGQSNRQSRLFALTSRSHLRCIVGADVPAEGEGEAIVETKVDAADAAVNAAWLAGAASTVNVATTEATSAPKLSSVGSLFEVSADQGIDVDAVFRSFMLATMGRPASDTATRGSKPAVDDGDAGEAAGGMRPTLRMTTLLTKPTPQEWMSLESTWGLVPRFQHVSGSDEAATVTIPDPAVDPFTRALLALKPSAVLQSALFAEPSSPVSKTSTKRPAAAAAATGSEAVPPKSARKARTK